MVPICSDPTCHSRRLQCRPILWIGSKVSKESSGYLGLLFGSGSRWLITESIFLQICSSERPRVWTKSCRDFSGMMCHWTGVVSFVWEQWRLPLVQTGISLSGTLSLLFHTYHITPPCTILPVLPGSPEFLLPDRTTPRYWGLETGRPETGSENTERIQKLSRNRDEDDWVKPWLHSRKTYSNHIIKERGSLCVCVFTYYTSYRQQMDEETQAGEGLEPQCLVLVKIWRHHMMWSTPHDNSIISEVKDSQN